MSLSPSRPAEAPTGPAAAVLAAAAGAGRRDGLRLAALTRDLFLADALRVGEARRSQVRRALDEVATSLEADLRRHVAERLLHVAPAALSASLESLTLPMARPYLEAAGEWADEDLVAVLARRVDEHRLVTQARVAALHDPLAAGRGLFAGLIAREGQEVGQAALAVQAAELRGFGRFEDLTLTPADLSAETHHRLVWRTAAALRFWFVGARVIAIGDADRAIAGGANILLAGHDESLGLDAAAMRLARAMLRDGIADDDATVALASEGHVAVAVAGLALRAGIPLATAWDMVLDPDGARLVLLLRAAGLGRDAAAALLLRWPDGATHADVVAERMAGFDDLSMQMAAEAIDLHRLDAAYARAVADLAPERVAA